MENQDKKRLLIITAALKRFAHYGLSKTTMTEIAKDIDFSKALLYYYFPDKLSLYVNVIEYLMHSISKDLLKSVEKTNTSTEGILMLLQKRQGYIQKYYNLLEYVKFGHKLPEDLSEKFNKAKAFEYKIITSLFNKGVESGEFNIDDTALTTELFIEALKGIHFNLSNRYKSILPDTDQFKRKFLKEIKFAEIFLSGLLNRPS